MELKEYYVYIMTNKHNTVLYTGVTNDLYHRIEEHKNKVHKGFTAKYNISKLVYYESYDDPYDAITREKQIKAGSRERRLPLLKGRTKNGVI
ncbi:MAG: GIY-YIG nuclease family protein [bacterium]